ncbi:MAG TPA: hypothetical protein VHU40_10415, partial [Polyangia bacterium]|nr:hypothetical protein [Polyangia bacterium]
MHDEPDSLAPIAGEAVDAAVRKALAKKREDRFPRVTDFAEALRDAVFGPARGSLTNVPVPSLGFERTSSVKVTAQLPAGTPAPGNTPAQTATTSSQPAPRTGTRKLLGIGLGVAMGIAAAVGVGSTLMKSAPEPVWAVADSAAEAVGTRLAMQVRRLVEEDTNHLADTAGRAGQVPQIAAALTGRVDEATFQDLLANEVWWADFRAVGAAVLVDDDVKVSWRLPATLGAPPALVKALAPSPDGSARAAVISSPGGPVLAAVATVDGVKGGRVLLVRLLNRAFLTDLATRANAVLLLSDGHKLLDVSVPENTLPEISLLVGQEAHAVQVDKRDRRLAAVMAWSPALWVWAVSGWTP